jgi:hypothetical protein
LGDIIEGGEREELPSEPAFLEIFDTGDAARLSQPIEYMQRETRVDAMDSEWSGGG